MEGEPEDKDDSTDWDSVLPQRPGDRPNGDLQRFLPGQPFGGRVVVGEDVDMPYMSFSEKRRRMNKKKRIVLKGGMTNVSYKNISKKRRRYFSDLYTTLLDAPWTYCVIMFSTSFYGSWLFFGALYYMICYLHGDLDILVLEEKDKTLHEPCIQEIKDFASCFLFSLETQHTIGYGTRQTTTQCPEAILVMSLQAVIGCIIQAFMVGLVFSKLSRPRNRSKTIIFSHHAVINLRDGKLCLVIRIGDLRDDNFILGTKISAKLIRTRTTLEGEIFQEMQNIKVDPETTSESCIFFVWPIDVVHIIDEESPFFDLTPFDLARARFEILILMEGTNETSNMTFQSRSSYLPTEIKWGKRFEKMLLYRKDQNKYQVNFSAFHSTYEVQTPSCSARDIRLQGEAEARIVTANPHILPPTSTLLNGPIPAPLLPPAQKTTSLFSMPQPRSSDPALLSRTNSQVVIGQRSRAPTLSTRAGQSLAEEEAGLAEDWTGLPEDWTGLKLNIDNT